MPPGTQLAIQNQLSACFSYRPKISVLVPVFRVPLGVLREMVESVLAQTYDNWEMCVVLASLEDAKLRSYLETAAGREPRILLKVLDANRGAIDRLLRLVDPLLS